MQKIEVEESVKALPSEKESDNEYDNIMQAYFDEKDDSKELPNIAEPSEAYESLQDPEPQQETQISV